MDCDICRWYCDLKWEESAAGGEPGEAEVCPWGEGLSWNGEGTGIRDKESGGLVLGGQQCRAMEAAAKRLISLSKQVEMEEERCLCDKGASGRCRTGVRPETLRGSREDRRQRWRWQRWTCWGPPDMTRGCERTEGDDWQWRPPRRWKRRTVSSHPYTPSHFY